MSKTKRTPDRPGRTGLVLGIPHGNGAGRPGRRSIRLCLGSRHRRYRPEDAAHGRARAAGAPSRPAAASRGGGADRAGLHRDRRGRHEDGRLRLHREAGQSGASAQYPAECLPPARKPSANWKSPGASCATPACSGSLVGASKKMQEIFALIERVAPSRRLGADHRRERHRQRTGRAHRCTRSARASRSLSSPSTARRFRRR